MKKIVLLGSLVILASSSLFADLNGREEGGRASTLREENRGAFREGAQDVRLILNETVKGWETLPNSEKYVQKMLDANDRLIAKREECARIYEINHDFEALQSCVDADDQFFYEEINAIINEAREAIKQQK